MNTVFYTLVIIVIAALVFRYWPVDTDAMHEDPAAPEKKRSEVRLIGREAPRYRATAEEVLEAFSDIATSDAGVHRVEGSVDEGMITFQARSRFIGFRDFITVKAVDEGKDLAKLSILSRPRINGHDWGVNAARLDRWLQEMEHAFPD